MRLKKPILFAASLLPVLAGVAAIYSCRSPQQDLTSPEGLRAALHASGLDYESREIPIGMPGATPGEYLEPGLYLRVPGDRRDWAELAQPEKASQPERWQGYVRAQWLGYREPPPAPGQYRRGNLLIVGDPAMVKEIAEALR